MKHISLITLTLAAALLAACGAPAGNTPAHNANTDAAKPTADALLALDKQANEAYFKGDIRFFEGMLSDRFVTLGPGGSRMDKGRGNSIKIINRVLFALTELGARVSALNGGNKSNAIPREAEALLFIPKKKVEEAWVVVEKFNETIRAELSTVEPDLAISLKESPENDKGKAITQSLQRKICQTLSALPHGVIKMSAEISWLVETSTNLAVIQTGKEGIVLTTSQRSSVASEMEEICQTVRSALELGKASVEQADGYPGWKPNLDSPILKVAQETYQSIFGKEPQVKAVHAGLECGIIGEKFPGMDMVSFGPTLRGVHSPDECIYIDSVERFWTFLLGILRSFQ